MPISQRVVQVCLFLVAAIAMLGGTLQMFLGQPDTLPRLDNVHRFMAGVYLSAAAALRHLDGPRGHQSPCVARRRPGLASATLRRAVQRRG
jgi:hypothetical protein